MTGCTCLPSKIQSMRLQGKVAIVTGAGAGIGESIAVRFAAEGASVVINDLTEEAAQRTAAKIQTPTAVVAGDVSLEETGQRLAAAALSQFGQLDIVVNNAANFTQMGLERATPADWEKAWKVNVLGTGLVCKAAVPHMKERGGSIVNIGSMSGIIAQPEFVTYNSSKGAVLMLTRCLALDYAKYKIRVNTVCPGAIETSATYRECEREGITLEQYQSRVAPLHMLGRMGQPHEVTNAVLFLASDEASFITAAELMVDGGYVHW